MRNQSDESWMQRSWRPILMLVITAILANHFLLLPLLHLFFGVNDIIPLPPELYTLLNIGVGGYVVGRSGEKIVGKLKS